MRKRTVGWALAFGAAAVACESPTRPSLPPVGDALFSASASAPVHQVTGGGKLSDVARDFIETYAFTASIDGDGNVKGEIQIRFADAATDEFHSRITCLSVNGNSAWLGGVITQTHDETLAPVGTEFWLRVQDNGQGAGALPDRMSSVRLGAPAAVCNEQRAAGTPWIFIDGNIKVR